MDPTAPRFVLTRPKTNLNAAAPPFYPSYCCSLPYVPTTTNVVESRSNESKLSSQPPPNPPRWKLESTDAAVPPIMDLSMTEFPTLEASSNGRCREEATKEEEEEQQYRSLSDGPRGNIISGTPPNPWKPKPTKVVPLKEFLKLQVSSSTGQRREETRKEEKHRLPIAADVPRGNVLDSTAPVLHKGKQREKPKKKFTKTKKIIINDRKQQRQQTGDNNNNSESISDELENTEANAETMPSTSENNQEELRGESSGTAGNNSDTANVVAPRNRRDFSKFLDNALSKELDVSVTALIKELIRFQDRLHAKDPEKARLKKRIVYGLREVHKLVLVEKVQFVILVPNIEPSGGEGGLDEIIRDTIDMCRDQNVPYVFALSKMKLGFVSHKHRPISCAGILNYQGADNLYKALLEITLRAKEEFVQPHVQTTTSDN